MGGAGAEAHCAYAAVEAGRAVGFEDGFDGVAHADGFDGTGAEGLHTGFDGVDWEHGHVFNHAGYRAGDHELPEVEAVVRWGDGYFGVVLGDGEKVGFLELG